MQPQHQDPRNNQQRPGQPIPPNYHQQQNIPRQPGPAYPQQPQGYRGGSVPAPVPANPNPNPNLERDMARMQLEPQPQPQPNLQQAPDVAPTRVKRAARAFHKEQPQETGYNDQGRDNTYQQQDTPINQQQLQTEPRRMQPQSSYGHQAPIQQHPNGPSSYGPPSEPGIAQPPHSNGQRIGLGQRMKIHPDSIPSPVAVQEADQLLYATEPYLTCSRTTAPLATTDFVAIDQGNCNPRFLRMTTYNLPHTDDLAVASHLPLGLVVQPFAPLRSDEHPIPVIDYGDVGPPRCERCRGYINAWCIFIEGGQKFICNLCGSSTPVTGEYFSHLDMSQRRMDLDQRPELRLGSVDFVVGKEYWVQEDPSNLGATPREPQPMNYIFAIDVSWTSGKCGLVREVVTGLKELFYPHVSEDTSVGTALGLPVGSKVAIMTFDRTVQFYNLTASLDQAQMLVVPDLTDMFLPLSDGFLVDPIESRSVIEGLLDSLPKLAAESGIVEAALGGPMCAAALSLKSVGGQVNIFQTCLPTIGPGALKHREDTKLYGTDKEKTLFLPQDPFYRLTAETCVESGIGVNLFLFPTQYIDVASLGLLPGITGGELFFHPRFEPVRDGMKLRAEIRRVVQRETGYSVTMRIRCSNGLRIADHFGNFFQRNVTDLEFGTIDADKAIAARIKHEGKLDEKVDAHFQCAVLYTSAAGQRRVRVHNIAVPVTSLLANVFRFADMDTTLAYIAKEAITQAASKTLRQVRDNLTDMCAKALLAYRKHCASTSSPAQLILPESFKLFPLYALALMKTKALKGGPVSSDVRTWHMRLIKSAGVAATIGLLYPRMLPIHALASDAGFPDATGRLKLPPLMRTSYVRMEPNGAYLIENGEIVILWLGASVSSQILQDLYAVENLDELDVRMATLPALPTLLSTQVRNILSLFETQRGGRQLPVLIARQNIDGTEVEFSNMLVEDANNEQYSYVDFLCSVHQSIQASLLGQERKTSESHDAAAFTTW